MKKAKFILAAIAVIGISSGALAFKAKHFGGIVSTWSICNTVVNKCNDMTGMATWTNSSLLGTVERLQTVFTSDENRPCTINLDCQVAQYTIYNAL